MKWYLCVDLLQPGHATWTEYRGKREASVAWLGAVKKYAHNRWVSVSLHQL